MSGKLVARYLDPVITMGTSEAPGASVAVFPRGVLSEGLSVIEKKITIGGCMLAAVLARSQAGRRQ